MYDLSERKPILLQTSTPEKIAPNTYLLCDTGGFTKKNVVPFCSSAVRKTVSVQPGGELYDPRIKEKIRLGNSLQFTAERFPYNDTDEWPGPTDYSPRSEGTKCKPVLRKRGNKGSLYMCKVPLSSGLNAPSVPTKIDLNGYDIGKDRELIKMPPDDDDQTLGPAFYDVPRGEYCYTSIKYRGCAWSKMTSRTEPNVFNTPDPGQYNITYNFCPKRKEDEVLKEMKRKYARLPRYTEATMERIRREDLPAPGQYDIKDMDVERKFREHNISLKPKPFIAREERWIYKSDGIPVSTKYQPCDCFKMQQKFSIKNMPFGSDTTRWKRKVDKGLLGPAWYNPSRKYKRVYYGVEKCGFDSKEPRKWTFQGTNVPELGPGEYDVPREEKNQFRKGDNNAFKSPVPRFKWRQREKSPESLDGRSTWPVIVKRVRPDRGSIPLKFTLKRFTRIPGTTLGWSIEPGPGDYELRTSLTDTDGCLNVSPRFTFEKDKPGPGHYMLHPSCTESTYKAKSTHNSRLMEEVRRSQLLYQKKPAETKKKKKDIGPTGKQLRWFAKPTEEYVHCFL